MSEILELRKCSLCGKEILDEGAGTAHVCVDSPICAACDRPYAPRSTRERQREVCKECMEDAVGEFLDSYPRLMETIREGPGLDEEVWQALRDDLARQIRGERA